MAMSRLYTFGCSFTNYKWNTWADIIGRDYEVFENWGQSGAGNQFVLNSLTECIQRNCLDSNDVVMIMWSTPCRDDRYVNKHWITKGNVFNSDYPKEWQENYCDPFGFLLRDLSFIASAKNILENLNIQYHMFSLTDFSLQETQNTTHYSWLSFETIFAKPNKTKDKLLKLYQPVLDVILPDVFSLVYKNDWFSCEDRLNYELIAIETLLKSRWEIWRGSDWPSLQDYVHNKQNLDNDVLKEIDLSVQDNIHKDIMLKPHDEKYVRCYDNHPTTQMYLEYLQTVLPNYVLPDSSPREKTKHGYEFERF